MNGHNFVVLPSVQALKFLRAHPESGGGNAFIGFGDPILDPPQADAAAALDGTERSSRSLHSRGARLSRSGTAVMANPAELKTLGSLPGTATELAMMASAVGAPSDRLFLKQRATETAFKQAPLTGLEILALATHGLVAGEMKGLDQPGLVFTPPAVASPADDGYLTASEIAELRIESDWVILSACNTAAGSGESAPGLSGLARAFILAGSRNLLVSHWYVLDEVAPELTAKAIAALRADPKLDRVGALQAAVRAVRANADHDTDEVPWSHPRAWAPFSFVGEGTR